MTPIDSDYSDSSRSLRWVFRRLGGTPGDVPENHRRPTRLSADPRLSLHGAIFKAMLESLEVSTQTHKIAAIILCQTFDNQMLLFLRARLK